MKRIRLTESDLHRIVKESVKRVLMEKDYHRGYRAGRSLDVLHTTDGTYRDEDVFRCLDELKAKLKQAEEMAMKAKHEIILLLLYVVFKIL